MDYKFPNGLGVFYKQIYKIVDDPSSDPIISWSKSNNSFVIWNMEELIRRDMLSIFSCSKFSEFHDELKYYGFRRIKKGDREIVRGQPKRLRTMALKTKSKRMAKFRAKEKKANEAADSMKQLQI